MVVKALAFTEAETRTLCTSSFIPQVPINPNIRENCDITPWSMLVTAANFGDEGLLLGGGAFGATSLASKLSKTAACNGKEISSKQNSSV